MIKSFIMKIAIFETPGPGQPGDPVPEPVKQPDMPQPKRSPVPGAPSETPQERPSDPGQRPDTTREHPTDPDPQEPKAPIGY